MEYTGVIKRVRFYSEETKFIVAVFDSEEESKPFTITGNMSYVNPDDKYRITGEFIIHPRYGQQFQIESYQIILADDRDEIIRYLSSPLFKGIGVKQAEAVYDTLGDEALEAIKEDPSCLDLVKGMTERKKATIVSVMSHQDYDQEVLAFFMGHGISTRNIALIQSVYKERTIEVLQDNPYQLIDDIDGIGFKSADTLAMKIGISPDDHNRLLAALKDAVIQVCFRSGSTYSDEASIRRMYFRNVPNALPETFDACLSELIDDHKIILEEDRIYPDDLYASEVMIAQYFDRFKRSVNEKIEEKEIDKKIDDVEEELGIHYDETQRNAIKAFLDESCLILTGGPGTGKTTIVQAVLKVYEAFYPEDEIALAAPTGRAAKRLSELSGLEATTIHRLLKWDLHTNTFAMNAMNPLETRLLVIDEFSMVDTLLFSRLLEAAPHVFKILLIGDDEQLPSVAPGNVLRDLIQSKTLPVIRLNTIYRQEEGSGIVALAHEVRNDEYNEDIFNQYNDIHMMPCASYQVISYVTKIVEKAIEEGYDQSDIQVLAPMYDGVAGIDALNIALQGLFNPQDEFKEELRAGRRLYREGDKILQLKNRPDDNVFNGDIGTLVEINKKDGVHFPTDTLVVDFDGSYIEYTSTDLNMITHAYCMSVHKSQGNEFKIVIMPALSDYSIMMRKNLLYTGLTRAKQSLFILGSPIVFMKGLGRIFDSRRHTTLQDRLTKKKKMTIEDFM